MKIQNFENISEYMPGIIKKIIHDNCYSVDTVFSTECYMTDENGNFIVGKIPSYMSLKPKNEAFKPEAEIEIRFIYHISMNDNVSNICLSKIDVGISTTARTMFEISNMKSTRELLRKLINRAIDNDPEKVMTQYFCDKYIHDIAEFDEIENLYKGNGIINENIDFKRDRDFLISEEVHNKLKTYSENNRLTGLEDIAFNILFNVMTPEEIINICKKNKLEPDDTVCDELAKRILLIRTYLGILPFEYRS